MFIEIRTIEGNLMLINLNQVLRIAANASGPGSVIFLETTRWFTDEDYENLKRRINAIYKQFK